MKDIFSYNADIDKTAYMNWRTDNYDHLHNMQVIASGFANSALSLVKLILDNKNRGKQADELIFPILFNANHAIEVYLKSLIWSLNVLLDNEETYQNTHHLKDLLEELKRLIKEYENGFDFEQHLGKLEKYINELYERLKFKIKMVENFQT